jgi:hypothetical protein
MKAAKIGGIVVLVYVALVVAFESLLGYMQPAGQGTLTIVTIDQDGNENARVLAGLTSRDQLYVAANHWPRAWYNAARANPNVMIVRDEAKKLYLAVPVTGEEHNQVQTDNPTGIGFRILTGFPPRYFVRLDPR